MAFRAAFQVTDDSKALQVRYNYNRIHSKFVSVKWKCNPFRLVLFDLQQSSSLWLLATTKKQKTLSDTEKYEQSGRFPDSVIY